MTKSRLPKARQAAADAIVVFGVTGDLAYKMISPGIRTSCLTAAQVAGRKPLTR